MYNGIITSPCTSTIGSNDEAKSSTSEMRNSYLSSCKYIRNVSEIFPSDSISTPYTLLIEGAPGIGKTILTKEIAFLWANRKILQDIKLLVSVYLRDPIVHKIATFTDFAKHITSTNHQNKMIEDFTNYLFNTSGKDIMFVFDGYDELPESLRQESFIANIIHRKMFPNSNMVITSRPSASACLHRKVEFRIEILGFTDDDRKMYIQRAFNNDHEKIDKTLTFLEKNPVVNSFCYIPLNMCILICLLRGQAQNELPKNQTEINNRFICMTISRYFQKEEKKRINILSLFDLQAEHMEQIKELAKLAFDLLGNDKIVFDYTDINTNSHLFSKNRNGLGLLKAVEHFNFAENCDQVSFNFLHFSFQEFLAAFHITMSSDTEQTKIMQEKFWVDRYQNMWIMYFGLTKGNSLPLIHFLSGNRFLWLAKLKYKGKRLGSIDEAIIEDKFKCLHLFQCFLEAGDEAGCQEVGNFLIDSIIDLSGQTMTSREMYALSFFLIRSAQRNWELLNLSNCCLDDSHFKILSETCLSEQVNSLSIKILDISSNIISSSSLHEICKVVLKLKIKKLILYNSLPYDEISAAFFNIVINDDDSNFCLPLTVVSIVKEERIVLAVVYALLVMVQASKTQHLYTSLIAGVSNYYWT